MAKANAIRLAEYVPGTRIKQTKWLLPPDAPRKPEDLNFVARDELGRLDWWRVDPPKTDYWHVHQVLGRAYAFELLDLMNNPAAEYPPHILAYITSAMWRWSAQVGGAASDGIAHGFFEVLSEFLGDGNVKR